MTLEHVWLPWPRILPILLVRNVHRENTLAQNFTQKGKGMGHLGNSDISILESKIRLHDLKCVTGKTAFQNTMES